MRIEEEGIGEEAIDCEVATLGIVLGIGEVDFGGMAAIEIAPLFAEGCDFESEFVGVNEDDAKGFANVLGAREKRANDVRFGVGCDVVIFGV